MVFLIFLLILLQRTRRKEKEPSIYFLILFTSRFDFYSQFSFSLFPYIRLAIPRDYMQVNAQSQHFISSSFLFRLCGKLKTCLALKCPFLKHPREGSWIITSVSSELFSSFWTRLNNQTRMKISNAISHLLMPISLELVIMSGNGHNNK